ncbi:tetratricopeptide repeat protein [Sorangium sp. So ce590]|uniref:tetratricopeptide repeat protein n=1 Tax=Sorangium sp. So ce590 TaxID=3133317 RepID=UPI003F619308
MRHVGPPEGAKERAWRGIASQLAAGAAVGVTTGAGAAAATRAGVGSLGSTALAIKTAAVLVSGGVVLGGAYLALSTPVEAPASHRAAGEEPAPAVVPQAPVMSAPEPRALPEPSVAGPTAGEPSRRPSGPKPADSGPKPTDLLRAESALLMEARAELRSGDVAAAAATLERLRAQFPRGVLRQEREVLAIDVLAARGNAQEAKRRAQAFVKQYPGSPHSAKLKRFLDPP